MSLDKKSLIPFGDTAINTGAENWGFICGSEWVEQNKLFRKFKCEGRITTTPVKN